MRLWILSDLHLNFRRGWVPPHIPVADVAVVAGDVGEGVAESLAWLGRTIAPHMPVVFVCGNHEFYRRRHPEELARARGLAPDDVHLLENDCVTILGTNFSGCTLWTDYDLFGTANRDHVMALAARAMNDHRLIGWDGPNERFLPQDAARLHETSHAYLSTPPAGIAGHDVVVTHHAPTPLSVAQRYLTDPVSAAFASDLKQLILRRRPSLWIHGHVHSRFDYCVGATRVVANPMGYPGENGEFDPALVIDLDA